MSDQSQTSSSMRGRWVVVVLFVVGLGLAIFAATYWRGVLDRTADSIQAQDISWKKEAREQLAQLQDSYTSYRAQGNIEPMIDKARELTERYPKLAGVHVLLGQMLLDANLYAQALQSLKESLTLNPRQPNIHHLAGNTALMIGDLSAAEHHFTQAISMDQTNGKYHLHLAQVYLGRRQFDEARMEFLMAMNLDSSLPEAYSGMSDLYARQNKINMALQQIDKAIDRTPEADHGDWVIYMRKKANLLRRDNKPAKALRILESLAPAERIQPAVMNEVALCFALLGKPQQAARLYDQALMALSLDEQLLEGAVRWHHKAGDIEAAKRHLRTLRKVDPSLPVIEKLEKLLATADKQ